MVICLAVKIKLNKTYISENQKPVQEQIIHDIKSKFGVIPLLSENFGLLIRFTAIGSNL